MTEGISTCKKQLDKLELQENLTQFLEENKVEYKEPAEDSKFYGLESHFNENVIFYKDVTIHGKINSKFTSNTNLILKQLTVLGISSFLKSVDFYENVYVDGDVSAGIVTARDRLDVGCGGTTLRVNTVTTNVGIGSTIPQQKLDVAGSVKIDATIYDSANMPGQNGYQLIRDARGVRWVPLIADGVPGVPGIATEGVFILNEGIPLYP